MEGRFVHKNCNADCTDQIDCISQTALVVVFSKGTFPEVCRYQPIGASQLTLANRYHGQRFSRITSPTLRWMESISSWRYGIRVVIIPSIAFVLWHTLTRTLFFYVLTFHTPIPWTTPNRGCVGSFSIPSCSYLYLDDRSGSKRLTTFVRDSLSSL